MKTPDRFDTNGTILVGGEEEHLSDSIGSLGYDSSSLCLDQGHFLSQGSLGLVWLSTPAARRHRSCAREAASVLCCSSTAFTRAQAMKEFNIARTPHQVPDMFQKDLSRATATSAEV